MEQPVKKKLSQRPDKPCLMEEHNVSISLGDHSSKNFKVKPNTTREKECSAEIKGQKISINKSNENMNGFRAFEERMEYYKEKHKKNIDIATMEYLNESQIECTFAPHIISRGKQNRTIQQFLQDQDNFLKQRNQRIKSIEREEMMKELKELQDIPKINKSTIYERRKSQSKDAYNKEIIQEKENKKQEAPTKSKNDLYLKNKLIKDIDDICKYKDFITSFENLCKGFI